MSSENLKWYRNCIESLFLGHKNSWVYKKVVEFSNEIMGNPKAEIILDTRCRFRALLDYTLDVFTGDRMENKSYQLPFAMYYIAKSMFGESLAAIASEAIMSVANWDYRVRSNLLRFILFDDNSKDGFIEKMTIFFMALEETKALENTHAADCSSMSFAEFYPDIVGEIERLDYEYINKNLTCIRSSKKNYYFIYKHALWKANEYRIPEDLQEVYAKCEKEKCSYSNVELDKILIDFIKMDMYEYINKGYVGSYSPFWIFGSMQYKQNIDFILEQKHIMEFDTVWIHYLSIKEKKVGQVREDGCLVDIYEDNVVDIEKWIKGNRLLEGKND